MYKKNLERDVRVRIEIGAHCWYGVIQIIFFIHPINSTDLGHFNPSSANHSVKVVYFSKSKFFPRKQLNVFVNKGRKNIRLFTLLVSDWRSTSRCHCFLFTKSSQSFDINLFPQKHTMCISVYHIRWLRLSKQIFCLMYKGVTYLCPLFKHAHNELENLKLKNFCQAFTLVYMSFHALKRHSLSSRNIASVYSA
jgi:hypothetical protein